MKLQKVCQTSFRANKMPSSQAKYVDSQLRNAKNIDIISHSSTDRDGLNSAIAMWEYLSELGINARIIIDQKNLNSLYPRRTDCNIIQANETEKINSITPDITFCVDFGEKERINKNLVAHAQQSGKIMGFDHHIGNDMVDENSILLTKSFDKHDVPKSRVAYYTDASAPSTTSIVYRFFESIGKEIDKDTAYDLFFGLVDDGVKRGLIICDGKRGIISPKAELMNDKNAYEIYISLISKLNSFQTDRIAKAIDIMSSLTPEEEKFQQSLYKNLKLSPNKKIAYVEIPPDDKIWQSLGGENARTSTILNRFRQDILNNKFDNDKLNGVEAAFVFYEANQVYRLSAHTKKPDLLKFYDYIEDYKIDDFTQNAGGHPARGGARLLSIDKDDCHNWVEKIISCDNFWQ
ncbi:MAG: DHH family phosphoesterase [Candidatus Gastranaerophilales bacterium]|nr:DHH family phosphoesterase [Candidatus Gastranaerophilales bacterium]